MINKLVEFEAGFMDNVVTLSNPAPKEKPRRGDIHAGARVD